ELVAVHAAKVHRPLVAANVIHELDNLAAGLRGRRMTQQCAVLAQVELDFAAGYDTQFPANVLGDRDLPLFGDAHGNTSTVLLIATTRTSQEQMPTPAAPSGRPRSAGDARGRWRWPARPP